MKRIYALFAVHGEEMELLDRTVVTSHEKLQKAEARFAESMTHDFLRHEDMDDEDED